MSCLLKILDVKSYDVFLWTLSKWETKRLLVEILGLCFISLESSHSLLSDYARLWLCDVKLERYPSTALQCTRFIRIVTSVYVLTLGYGTAECTTQFQIWTIHLIKSRMISRKLHHKLYRKTHLHIVNAVAWRLSARVMT